MKDIVILEYFTDPKVKESLFKRTWVAGFRIVGPGRQFLSS